MEKQTPHKFVREFFIDFLPHESLVGIRFGTCEIIEESGPKPMFRIEIGIPFFTFSYTNVNYSKSN